MADEAVGCCSGPVLNVAVVDAAEEVQGGPPQPVGGGVAVLGWIDEVEAVGDFRDELKQPMRVGEFGVYFLEAVPSDAFRTRRYEGPHRITQKRPRSFVWALRGIAMVKLAKNQLLRDFRRRSIFDFCNTICHELTLT